jgi:hypothetical protein
MYSGRLHVGGLLERVTFGCFSSLSAGLYNCLIRFLFKFHAAMELAYVFLQLSAFVLCAGFWTPGCRHYPRALVAGVQKAPGHEIVGRMGGGATGAIGICRRFGLAEVGFKRSPRSACGERGLHASV